MGLKLNHISKRGTGNTHMRQWTWSSLVQEIVCHLFSANVSPAPHVVYWLLEHQQEMWMKIESKHKIIFKDKHLDISSTKWRLFCVLFQPWLWGRNDEWRKTVDQTYSGELCASGASGTPCLEHESSHRSGRESEPGSCQWGWH